MHISLFQYFSLDTGMVETFVSAKFCCNFIEFLSNPDILPQAYNVYQTIFLNTRSETSGECVTSQWPLVSDYNIVSNKQ